MLPCAVWDQIPPLWPVDFAGKLDSNGIGCVEAAGGEKGTMLFLLQVMASAWSWLTFSHEVEAIPEHSESGSYWELCRTLCQVQAPEWIPVPTFPRATDQCSGPQLPAAWSTRLMEASVCSRPPGPVRFCWRLPILRKHLAITCQFDLREAWSVSG